MSIEAVIFDLGGVIMRTEDPGPRAALAERLGMTYRDLAIQVFDGPESRRAQVGEISAEEFWMATSAKYGVPYDFFFADFFKGDQLDQVLIAAIRGLRARYKTGLLSNAFSDLRTWIEKEWKFADAFHDMVVSAEVKMMKPDPAIYAYSLKKLGVDANAAVFVDDLAVNVEAARQAGMQAIQFQNREQALAELHAILDAA